MPRARNVEPEVRAKATVELLELATRGQVPDGDDVTSDYAFMAECLGILCSDLRVLKQQASAAWTGNFGALLDSAEAIRCVEIPLDEKDPRRVQKYRCDACGRYEKWCGKAIDLGGGAHKPERWWKDHQFLEVKFEAFINDYAERVNAEPKDGQLQRWDLGRFYIGSTCLRKAKLHFMASTLVPELLYTAWTHVHTLSKEEMRSGPMQWANEETAVELLGLKEQLELCIAQEHRQDMPELPYDAGYWAIVDAARSGALEADLTARSGARLANAITNREKKKRGKFAPQRGGRSGEPSDSSDDGERSGDEDWLEKDDGSDSGDGSEEEDRQHERLCPSKTSNGRRKRRAVVVEDDEEEAGEEEAEQLPRAQPPTRPRPVEATGQPPKRSARLAGLQPGEEVAAQGVAGEGARPASRSASPLPIARPPKKRPLPRAAVVQEDEEDENENKGGDEEGVNLEDLVDTRRVREGDGGALRRTAPAPHAVRLATAMRIPGADGRAPALGSRQAVLVQACELCAKLTRDGRNEDASVLDAVIVSYRDLMARVERARGTQSSA